MNIKQIWDNHSVLIFKIVSLVCMIVFFYFSGWKGIIGFFLGLFYIAYLIFTDNPQFNAVLLGVKFKKFGDANNEIYKKN